MDHANFGQTPFDDQRRRAEGRLFARGGGIMRMAESAPGRRPTAARCMPSRDAGLLEQLGRGLYRLADDPPLSNPDLVALSRRAPRAVRLPSSPHSAFHGLTTQVHTRGVPRRLTGQRSRPGSSTPPVRVFRFGTRAFGEGVETHRPGPGPGPDLLTREDLGPTATNTGTWSDSIPRSRRYGDTATRARSTSTPSSGNARTCRVEKVIRPYLEAIL